MTTTVNNNENKVLVNRIGFSGSFYKFLGEDIKIGNQILYPGNYKFDYLIKLNDECKNGYLTFSFTGSIKIKKGNGRYYDFIFGAIGDIIAYFKPELSIFEKLHTCNHLGQPTYIDNIRYHINEGKSNQEISEMYNISDMKAIEILRNASDDKNLFYYLVFRLGIAENWENLAGEAIQEIEKRNGSKLKIENKDRVFKQFPEKECEVLENLYQLGYASKVQKELRDKARKEEQKQKELKEIEDERNKAIAKAQKSKVLKSGESETRLPTQSEKESPLNDKGKDKAKQIEKDNAQFLSEIDRNIYNVSENNEYIFILKPKETCAIDFIKIGKEPTKDDPIKIVGVSGQKYYILFDGESIETSLLHSNTNVRIKETEKIFTYLEEKGYTWEQPDCTKFYLMDKENEYLFGNEFEAYLFLRDGSIQPKEAKPIIQYTDDMLELVSLDLDSMKYTVNGDIGTEKDIASIVLYDKIGKIVVFFEDGEKREYLFDGESILQSVLKDNLK